jgi:enoyl-CoA hydratase/carnithine racemase
MADEREVLYQVEDAIATITLNRPERMNSFSPGLIEGWEAAIRRATDDDEVRVVVITGSGRAFCAGADLKASGDANYAVAAERNAGERRNSLRHSVHRVPQALQYLDKPYIAAVNGPAVGAGMDMVSMADIRIASDQARFGMSYVNVGLIPGDGGAWLLPRIVGTATALELIWTGEIFGAERALELGYVQRSWMRPTRMRDASRRGRQSRCSSRSGSSTARSISRSWKRSSRRSPRWR